MARIERLPAGRRGPTTTEFRHAVGRFATGVCVVTTRVDGIDHAMTASSFTSVSLDPLRVLVCVERQARFHDAILRAGTWGVNVLAHDMADVSAWFATRGRPLTGQLGVVEHEPGPHTGAALFPQALATLECRTTESFPGGDHTVVLGEVLAVDIPRPDDLPLLYWRGAYHDVVDEDMVTDTASASVQQARAAR